MKKIDARSLSSESLELLRRQALTLRRETTLTWAEIAKVCGVSISTVMKWSRWFAGQGEAAFVPKRRGRKHGSGRTLTLAQELKLRETILEQNPGQLKLPFALWNRRAVQDAVRRIFGIEMPIRTVGEYLLRWGFTPQRPTRQAIERNDAALAACRKVFLIVDNLKVHHSRPVKAWVAERAEKIELVYLPSYSPQANPDEYLNRDLKTALRQGPVARTTNHLLTLASAFMRQLQSVPGRVVSYFKHPAVSYVHIS